MSYDVMVIGGGPAGLSAALNVRARGRSVLVVTNPPEENPLWKAERVDNYLGMPGVSGAELLEQLRRHAEAAGPHRQGSQCHAHGGHVVSQHRHGYGTCPGAGFGGGREPGKEIPR